MKLFTSALVTILALAGAGVSSYVVSTRTEVGANITALAVTNAPKPKYLSVTGGIAVAPDSTIRAGSGVRLSNYQVASDTVVFRYYRNDSVQTASVTRKPAAATVLDTAFLSAPVYGATAIYKGCVQIERGGRTGLKFPAAACSVSWSRSYTRPDLPPPTIDTLWQLSRLILRPTRATLFASTASTAGTKQQFCAFGLYKNGQKGQLNPLPGAVPFCDSLFAAFEMEQTI